MSHLPVVSEADGRIPGPNLSRFPCVRQDHGEQAALHLPTAPRCNVQCGYCDRSGDCANNSPKGKASTLLTPLQAVAFALEAIRCEPRIVCAGISGPGDPLANVAETFLTLQTLRARCPELPFFISTNGIALADHAEALGEIGVSLCTVTVNAVEPSIVSRLIDWVQSPQGLLAGEEAAAFLLERQMSGIQSAISHGIAVRANVQLIPKINDHHVEAIAKRLAQLGVRYLHLRAFEPSEPQMQAFSQIMAPTAIELSRARELVSRHVELVKHCPLCASDSVGCLAGGQVREVKAALQSSARQRDVPPEVAVVPSNETVPDLGERGVALRQLQLIAKVARWLATSEEPALDTLRRVLVWLDEQLGLKRAVITLADASGEVLQAQVTHGIEPEQAERMHYRLDEGITGQVFATGRGTLLPSIQADPSFLDRSGLRAGLDLTRLAFFCVPIRDRGTIIGTLSADKDNTRLKDADSNLTFLEEIGQLLAPFVQRGRLEESLSLFRRLRSSEGPFARLLGRSSVMDEVRRLIARVAPTNTSILLTGETGTGKSAAAVLAHELSPHANEPFIEVNCGAIPDSLIESELFGHEKGAFTGALQRRLGVFERARGGTVFLDEVGELGPSAQTRLLRVLQTRRFERVGGSETLTTGARVIAATNRDLAAAVADGSFRSDLFYRLSVFPICMPPLRERGKADIILLADSFVDRHGRKMKKTIFRIDTPAIDMLTAYHWPGNVRELENVIERALVLAESDVIHGHHLPPSLQMNRYSATPEQLDFASRVAAFETELITEALKDSNGNQTKAAERLGVTKRVIQYKIRSYGIPWERFLPKH
jgi:Nif-specific regulatory protein